MTEALQDIEKVGDLRALEAWRVQYLGRKGALTDILRGLAGLSIEERRVAGARANVVKVTLENRYKEAQSALTARAEAARTKAAALDISLPGFPYLAGHGHPLTQAIDEICDIFHSMGFQVALGPDVEWDYYNFEALNMPKEHPARDSMSTFWVDHETQQGEQSMLLRTHCTAVSARVIHDQKPPIRVVEPGRVYRYEATDATHLNAYHNIDGLAVDKGITMADLKGTLYEFARRYFGPDRKVRFRPDYFPFVEPGVEMAISCAGCRGEGCRLCGQSGWLEILGAGMTHPDVLRRGGIDPEVYTSFAFGMGVERLPMLRYGIEDMRLFYGGDLRFLSQF
ncbi:MAG: phenylalanine--tRNA ligase subunit alpha [Chloroflexi bacterium RBG_16_57_8]|nr:MAG: phenylalanine--tRNA ligase subunit alpha [Chloroflexi bacterium RBG_16_57_8]